jgi:hypothetical protein
VYRNGIVCFILEVIYLFVYFGIDCLLLVFWFQSIAMMTHTQAKEDFRVFASTLLSLLLVEEHLNLNEYLYSYFNPASSEARHC